MNAPIAYTEMLLDEQLLDELHGFLWSAPYLNQGVMDQGWMCRDHAAVVGHVLIHLGARVAVRHGKCMFVQGPTSSGAPPVGLGQEGEAGPGDTWLWVEGLGHVDVSPNLGLPTGPWRPLQSPGVGASWIAPGVTRFLVTESADSFGEEIAKATWATDERRAVYWLRREDVFDEVARTGLAWPNSKLSLGLLRQGLPANLCARLAMHSLGVVTEGRRPLARLSRNKAWRLLATDRALT